MAYIGKSIESGTFSVLDTSGNTYNGSNVTFSLGTQVGSPAQLLVSHDGVIQKPGTDYSLATGGTQITFTTAPASGASIFIVEISGAVGGPLDSDLNGTELILDADADTSITADTDDQIDIKVAGTDQITIKDGALSPVTDNDIDLGTSSLEFKDGYFDGTLHCDVIDLAGTEYTAIASTMNGLTDVSMDITNFQNGILIQTGSDGSAPTTGTLSTATGNVGIGHNVMKTITSGDYNVAVGHGALDALTTGQYNVAIGGDSPLGACNTGSKNVAIGNGALLQSDGESANIAIGSDTLTGAVNGGEYNVAMGDAAGTAVTTGDNNTIVGREAGHDCTTGENNTFIGGFAGDVAVGGSNNICIGYEADLSANDISHGITIGYNMTSSSNVFAFGKSGDVVSNTFSSNANWSRSSDIRKKREIYDQGLGLDFINDLRTVNFQWKPQNEFPKEWNDYNETSSNDTEVVMHGFIAQEVKEALDKHASKRDSVFAGWSEGEDGMQHTSREMFVIPLIKAVQELSTEVKELKAKLEDK
jgi:hypothetical protein